MFRTLTLSTAAAALLATPTLAATEATATTDLNLRAGPGPQYEVVDVIANDDAVTLETCTEGADWCEVSYGDTKGWAYAPYLEASLEGETVYVAESLPKLEVTTVTSDEAKTDAAVGAGFVGGVAGALLGGPAGAAAGAAIAGGTAAVTVPEETITYIRENRMEPVYLEGEVVTGAVVPQEVEITPVPDSDYAYLYVNGVPAVVDPEDRSIVHVVR